ncbi:MAG: thioredoxin domain-containing protein [Acidobacteriaceae bacterium]|nr:thioredoxin domain-containing protein [Acidobacteriaceae bacterium]
MIELRTPIGPEDHTQGDPNAPVTLVEYGDYECPHCGRAYPIIKRLQEHFGGKLLFVYRNFPLTRTHPNAEPAAEAAEFAATQGKFWEMHDLLFEHQNRLGPKLYEELAIQLGLDPVGLTDALDSGQFRERVRADFMGGVRSGVNGTPTFYINGQRHDGAFDYRFLVEAIASVLSG